MYILTRIWVETTLFYITSNGNRKSFLKHRSTLDTRALKPNVQSALLVRRLKKTVRFPLDVMQNSVVSTSLLAKIYRA